MYYYSLQIKMGFKTKKNKKTVVTAWRAHELVDLPATLQSLINMAIMHM
jgi:hypothetical protein